MRSRCKVSQGQSVSGQPVARLHEPADIAEMIANIVARRAQRLGIGRTAALLLGHMTLEDSLVHEGATDLGVKFVVEPVCQAPHLDATPGLGRQQAILTVLGLMGLLDIFSDDSGTWNRWFTLGDQNRQ